METKFNDVAHLYLGCKCKWAERNGNVKKGAVITISDLAWLRNKTFFKPVLRLLPSITENEAKKMIAILFSDVEDKIDVDEIDIELVPGDGGNMVDGDMEIVIPVICRCFEGQIAIRKCGSIILYDEQGELVQVANTPSAFLYLLKQGFDLFGLIKSSQAIDKTTLTS